MHDKYGEVVRVAPNTLSYTGAQAWRGIFDIHEKHETYDFTNYVKDIYGYRQGMKQMPKDAMFYIRTGQVHSDIISKDTTIHYSRYIHTNRYESEQRRRSQPVSYFAPKYYIKARFPDTKQDIK